MPFGLYYGWVVVVAGSVVLMAAYGLQHSYGVFLPHIVGELGWDRATVSAPYSIYVLVYSLLSYVSGRLTDRVGPRVVVLVGAMFIGSGYFAISRATERLEVYLYFGLVAGIGMSTMFVPLSATVVRWFSRRRGLALGVVGSGVNAAAFVGPLLATALIATLGWRAALAAAALGSGLVIALAAVFLHRDPATRGLAVDGSSPTPVEGGPATADARDSRNLREALATSEFWLILGIYVSTWIALFFPFVHLPAHGLELGMSAEAAAGLVGSVGVGGVVGRIAIGWLSDRVGSSAALRSALALQVGAFAALGVSDHAATLYLAAFAFGAGSGAGISLFGVIVGATFGRGHIGAISGLLFAAASGASALGPYLGGLARDVLGDYGAAFLACAACNVLGLALSYALMPAPVRGVP